MSLAADRVIRYWELEGEKATPETLRLARLFRASPRDALKALGEIQRTKPNGLLLPSMRASREEREAMLIELDVAAQERAEKSAPTRAVVGPDGEPVVKDPDDAFAKLAMKYVLSAYLEAARGGIPVPPEADFTFQSADGQTNRAVEFRRHGEKLDARVLPRRAPEPDPGPEPEPEQAPAPAPGEPS